MPRPPGRVRPLRNASYQAIAGLGGKAISFLLVFYATRALGPALFGNYTTIMAWLVYTRFLPRRLDLDPGWWPVLLRNAAPFMVLTLLSVVYSRADMQILYVLSGCGHMAGNAGCAPVGDYGAAYRFLDVLVA